MELFVRNCDHIDNLLSQNTQLATTVAHLVTLGEMISSDSGLGVIDGPLYENDADAECVYQLLGADDIAQQRKQTAAIAARVVHSDVLGETDLLALMNACNVARLSFARHLGKFDASTAAPLTPMMRDVLDEGFRLLSFIVSHAGDLLYAG